MTTPSIDFLPTSDPLLRYPQLDYALRVPILGIDTRFESNSRYVLGVAAESFGEAPATPEHGAEPGELTVRVIVHAAAAAGDDAASVRHVSTDDGRLFVHSAGSMAIVDPARRESLAYVTTMLLADRDRFRETVLEAITFALLAASDRHPVHAAAIAHNGRALLLAAPSGTGKSTIAWLAHRSGMTVVSDERVWVQLAPALRIWGGRPGVCLLAEAATHFPELAQRAAQVVTGGKFATALGRGAPEPAAGPPCDRATVCVMARGAAVALERIGGSQLEQDLVRQLTPGFDRFADRHARVVRALAADGGWRLTLSNDPFAALPLLQRMLDDG